ATSVAVSTTCTCLPSDLSESSRREGPLSKLRSRISERTLVVPALAIEQAPGRRLFSFAVDGKQLPSFAAVSRVKRDVHHELSGYQRAESLSHIRTIQKYLESADAILPNALVVAFD